METLWFILIAFMITAYVVLDGFDLGAGIISLFVAKNHDERRVVLRTIGPVWDGNEVWLLAAGGALFFAFPLLYASSFSGFYLPLMMVLWLLILRGIGVELRSHVHDSLWWSACDFLFMISSFLLAVFFGAAIGNVIRGVPLNSDGYFFEPLWTNFRVGQQNGILDWYTVLIGLLSFVTLTVHGANYIALKTVGDISRRSRNASKIGWFVLVFLTIASLFASIYVQPLVLNNFRIHLWGWIIPIFVAAALACMLYFNLKNREKEAFFSSTAYIVGMLGGAAFAMYPYLLPSSIDLSYSLTIENAKTGAYSLNVGFIWWSIGILLAIGYFTFLYWSFRGKILLNEEDGY